MTYPQGVEPAPVRIPSEESRGRRPAICESQNGRTLEAESFHVRVSHTVVVDFVKVLSVIAATAEQRAKEGPGRRFFMVGADDPHSNIAVGFPDVVICIKMSVNASQTSRAAVAFPKR